MNLRGTLGEKYKHHARSLSPDEFQHKHPPLAAQLKYIGSLTLRWASIRASKYVEVTSVTVVLCTVSTVQVCMRERETENGMAGKDWS